MTASPPVPRPPLTAIPADITCLADYERHAAGHLPEASRHHVDSGTGEGLTPVSYTHLTLPTSDLV